jgi:hypothetical protein
MPTIFTPEYKDKLFLDWFSKGKPGYVIYHRLAPVDELTQKKPTTYTINEWMIEEWKPRAELLDEQIKAELEDIVVKEKVEMLRRHAKIGTELTDKALKYLREHKFTSSNTALRAIVQGVRIERESRGIPEALEKMSSQTDEDLLEDVKSILDKSTVKLEPNE